MRAGRSAGDLLDAEWDPPEVEGPQVEVPRRLVDVDAGALGDHLALEVCREGEVHVPAADSDLDRVALHHQVVSATIVSVDGPETPRLYLG